MEVWTGQTFVDARLCPVCYQPECPDSTGGERPAAGASPSRLPDGEHEYRGYSEWVVHPNEACFLLHRGYAVVDGIRQRVMFIHNEAHVTQLRVEGTFADADERGFHLRRVIEHVA